MSSIQPQVPVVSADRVKETLAPRSTLLPIFALCSKFVERTHLNSSIAFWLQAGWRKRVSKRMSVLDDALSHAGSADPSSFDSQESHGSQGASIVSRSSFFNETGDTSECLTGKSFWGRNWDEDLAKDVRPLQELLPSLKKGHFKRALTKPDSHLWFELGYSFHKWIRTFQCDAWSPLRVSSRSRFVPKTNIRVRRTKVIARGLTEQQFYCMFDAIPLDDEWITEDWKLDMFDYIDPESPMEMSLDAAYFILLVVLVIRFEGRKEFLHTYYPNFYDLFGDKFAYRSIQIDVVHFFSNLLRVDNFLLILSLEEQGLIDRERLNLREFLFVWDSAIQRMKMGRRKKLKVNVQGVLRHSDAKKIPSGIESGPTVRMFRVRGRRSRRSSTDSLESTSSVSTNAFNDLPPAPPLLLRAASRAGQAEFETGADASGDGPGLPKKQVEFHHPHFEDRIEATRNISREARRRRIAERKERREQQSYMRATRRRMQAVEPVQAAVVPVPPPRKKKRCILL